MNILFIEDNPGDQALYNYFLQESSLPGIKVVNANSLESALKKLLAKEIDIIFLDLNLPDSDGLGSYRKIAEKYPHIPVVILTGLDDTQVALTALQNGAQDYLVKGEFNAENLKNTIVYSIERHKAKVR